LGLPGFSKVEDRKQDGVFQFTKYKDKSGDNSLVRGTSLLEKGIIKKERLKISKKLELIKGSL